MANEGSVKTLRAKIELGYGLAMRPGSNELLAGLLMVDRPRPADPQWLADVEATFGECHLVAMTAAGERGIACQMQIENAPTDPTLDNPRPGSRVPSVLNANS